MHLWVLNIFPELRKPDLHFLGGSRLGLSKMGKYEPNSEISMPPSDQDSNSLHGIAFHSL